MDKMDFKRLDIPTDVEAQGFGKESYDIMVAAAVLHAMPDLAFALQNIRCLLKEGGDLILLELCGAICAGSKLRVRPSARVMV